MILEVQPPLKSLLSDIGAGVTVIGSGEEAPAFDLQCPLLSLPLAFATALDTIPADIPYLRVPAERIAQWSERLPPRRALRVGLVWSGNATHKDDHNRSIAFARLAPLFATAGLEFVSLNATCVRRTRSFSRPILASPISAGFRRLRRHRRDRGAGRPGDFG